VGCGKWLNQPGDLYDYTVIRNYLNPALWSSCGPSRAVSAEDRRECPAPNRLTLIPHGLATVPIPDLFAWLLLSPRTSSSIRIRTKSYALTTDGSDRQIRFSHTDSSMALQGFDA